MDYRFGKTYRLLKTEEFSSVFALRRQIRGKKLTVSFSGSNGLSHARLGLVVAKKTAKRANKRNYMKRVIREWFRHRRPHLPPVDLVIRVGVRFEHGEAREIWQQLDEQTQKIRFRQP